MKLYITAVTKKNRQEFKIIFYKLYKKLSKIMFTQRLLLNYYRIKNFPFSLSLLQLSNDSKEFYYFVSQVKQKIKSQPQKTLKFEILLLFFDIKNCWKMHYFHRQSYFKFHLSHPVYLNTVSLLLSPLSFYPSFSIYL